jgi:MMP 1-O-methyltransferase
MNNDETIKKIHQQLHTQNIKGFLAPTEAEALFHLAYTSAALGPCLEIGSYCGKSTVYIGSACKLTENILFAVDHHRGSEEHQLGEEYHDPDLYNVQLNAMDTFPTLRHTLNQFDLEDCVVPLVAPSQIVVKKWATPLGFVFIDGGHSEAQATIDCLSWASQLNPGGILAIHDIFDDPARGGQGPFRALQSVLSTGKFNWISQVESLGILQCCAD